MTLKNSLYTITQKEASGDTARFDVTLNASHVIYQVHFPGHPVTPGVCIIQTARELVEELVCQPLTVSAVRNAKFLAVLSPEEHPVVTFVTNKVQTSPCEYKVTTHVKAGDMAVAKISLVLKEQ